MDVSYIIWDHIGTTKRKHETPFKNPIDGEKQHYGRDFEGKWAQNYHQNSLDKLDNKNLGGKWFKTTINIHFNETHWDIW